MLKQRTEAGMLHDTCVTLIFGTLQYTRPIQQYTRVVYECFQTLLSICLPVRNFTHTIREKCHSQ